MTSPDDYRDRTGALGRYGDWGGVCMAALGTSRWLEHVKSCASCAAVQRKWDAQREAQGSGRRSA